MRRYSQSIGLDRHVAAIAAVVVVGAIMSILDTTIVNIALHTLSRDLHASLDDVQWVATGYLLSLALVIPLTGWASERWGARRVWLVFSHRHRHEESDITAYAEGLGRCRRVLTRPGTAAYLFDFTAPPGSAVGNTPMPEDREADAGEITRGGDR